VEIDLPPTSVFIPPRPRNPVTSTARITRIRVYTNICSETLATCHIHIYINLYNVYLYTIYIYYLGTYRGTRSCARCTTRSVYYIIYFFWWPRISQTVLRAPLAPGPDYFFRNHQNRFLFN